MRIIFLDVDGELTYRAYKNEETANIDPEKVELLKEICDRTGAKVVISSSWRGTADSTPYLYHVLRNILDQYGIDVLGDTPYIEADTESESEIRTLEDLDSCKMKHGTGRAAEIESWLNDHEVDNFVILDDEDWDWTEYGFEKNWIQPTWFENGGLKREHVEAAVRILLG